LNSTSSLQFSKEPTFLFLSIYHAPYAHACRNTFPVFIIRFTHRLIESTERTQDLYSGNVFPGHKRFNVWSQIFICACARETKMPSNSLLERIRNVFSSKTQKEESPAKRAEKKENSPSGCPHRLGYLASRPKNASIPQECLTCKKILECMHG
jgi:hypothetical protein